MAEAQRSLKSMIDTMAKRLNYVEQAFQAAASPPSDDEDDDEEVDERD